MQTEIHNSIKPSNYSRANRARPKTKPEARPSKGFIVKHEISAGGIIFKRRGNSIEIFFIKDPYNRWTFPKGHQERGETLVQTAVREIKEETGLDKLKYISQLGRTSFRFKRQNIIIQKIVYLFLFEAPLDAKETLTGEGAIFEGKWAKAHEVFSVSGYKNLDRLLARALRGISAVRNRR
ncbi:MAG: NUDIX domain-containing protein [Patescibacteria group bacterium]